MVCAFRGWNDAGDAASSAVAFLAGSLEAKRFAHLDPEEFYDFQSNRPCISLGENQQREISWPTVEIFEATAPRAPRDLVLVQGTEPSMRWRSFSAHLVDLAEALGVQAVVTLGALLGDVPHTRPVSLSGHASDASMFERLGIQPSAYEGPTGIVGVLHTACADAGLPSASLWAAVPHYVAAANNPKAALALLRRVEAQVGLGLRMDEGEFGGQILQNGNGGRLVVDEDAAFSRRQDLPAQDNVVAFRVDPVIFQNGLGPRCGLEDTGDDRFFRAVAHNFCRRFATH